MPWHSPTVVMCLLLKIITYLGCQVARLDFLNLVPNYDLGTRAFQVLGVYGDDTPSYHSENFRLDHCFLEYFEKTLWYLPSLQKKFMSGE